MLSLALCNLAVLVLVAAMAVVVCKDCPDSGSSSWLDALNASKTLSSPNYPDLYPSMADCLWRLRAYDQGFVVRVEVQVADLEDTFHSSCEQDYVTFHDGADVTGREVGKVCGDDTPTSYSTGRFLAVVFRSGPYRERKGFRLLYRQVHPSQVEMPNHAIITFVCIGGIAVVMVIIIVVCVIVRRRQQRARQAMSETVAMSPSTKVPDDPERTPFSRGEPQPPVPPAKQPPPQQSWVGQAGYPPQSGYPPQPGYPGYPYQYGYPPPLGYVPYPGYAPPGGYPYPPQPGFPPSPGHPDARLQAGYMHPGNLPPTGHPPPQMFPPGCPPPQVFQPGYPPIQVFQPGCPLGGATPSSSGVPATPSYSAVAAIPSASGDPLLPPPREGEGEGGGGGRASESSKLC